MAGGLPSADTFPVQAMRDACDKVLRDAPREALQYAASEGFAPLREWVAQHLAAAGPGGQAEQVLITTGSQQGLDLAAKVLIDAGAPVAVETPTYLGALQAFAPYEPSSCRSSATTTARCRSRLRAVPACAGRPLRLPAAQFPEPDRPRDSARPARGAGAGGARGRRAAGRRQPVRRLVVRPAAAAGDGVVVARGQRLPRFVLQGADAGLSPRLHRGTAPR